MGVAQKPSATNLRNFRTFLLMQQFAAREIGARIAQARREADGMTQDDLADALNVSKRSVQEYEAGNTIPWKHFSRLEEVFEQPLAWFLRGEERSDEETKQLDERLEEVERLAAESRQELEEVAAAVGRIEELLRSRAAES